jgi:[ribosomal protein S5]-alanine N-acetyltransferase
MFEFRYEMYLRGIGTERLFSRLLTPMDKHIWFRFFESEEATRYLVNPKNNQGPSERAGLWIEKQLERYKKGEFGVQALIHNETQEFVGQCGLLLQEVDGKEELEVGYHIMPKFWNMGYATEAAKGFVEFNRVHHFSDSLISLIHINNYASQKVAEKCGMEFEKLTVWRGLNVLVYRLKQF